MKILTITLALLTCLAFAQTGGTMTGGSMTGGMTGGMTGDSSAPSVTETTALLEGGLTDIALENASSNIESWRNTLSSASNPALNTLADQLGELQSALSAETIDQGEVSRLLTSIGEGTIDAADQAEGDQVAQLVDLGTVLLNAGQLLSSETGGMTGGSMTGGN